MDRLETGALCCECYNCVNRCPRNAISIEYDCFEVAHPVINNDKCIDCGLCTKVCPINTVSELNPSPESAYAFLSNSKEVDKSSSGGMAYELAKSIIQMNGCVVGVRYAEDFQVKYSLAESIDDLAYFQGSKYVCAYIGNLFQQVKDMLNEDRVVMFVGTPCHVAALKLYLGRDLNNQNLLTVDLICHGTPPRRIFEKYIDYLQKKRKKKVIEYRFRNKQYKRNISGEFCITNGRKRIWKTYFFKENSYFRLFDDGLIDNTCCYKCNYARSKRVGDITLGDFWGIENEVPQFFDNKIEARDRVSAVIINNEKGLRFAEPILGDGISMQVDYSAIKKHQPHLTKPITCNGELRNDLMFEYQKNEYKGIEKIFRKNYGLTRYSHRIKSYLGLLK